MSDLSASDAQLNVCTSTLSVSPQWAQIRILLNLGKASSAAKATLALMDDLATDPAAQVPMAGAGVLGLNDVPRGWVFMDPERLLILMNLDVLETFASSALVERWLYRFHGVTKAGWKRYNYQDWCAQEPWLLEDEDAIEKIEDWLNGS